MRADDPRHGTYAGHIAHRKDGEESCQPCKDARTRYEKRYRAYGSTIIRLGEDAFAILSSVPRREIELAGLHSSHVTRIKRNGPDGRVTRKTRDLILEVGRWQHVTHVGAARRLQALAALGWSTTEIAPYCGIHPTNLGVIRRGGRQHYIRRSVAAGIAEAYRVLSMRIPPEGRSASWTRTFARSNGWLAPLWWDDERIDDPRYRPRAGARPVEQPAPRKADHEAAECPRCGVRRQVRSTAKAELCVDCKSIERKAG